MYVRRRKSAEERGEGGRERVGVREREREWEGRGETGRGRVAINSDFIRVVGFLTLHISFVGSSYQDFSIKKLLFVSVWLLFVLIKFVIYQCH